MNSRQLFVVGTVLMCMCLLTGTSLFFHGCYQYSNYWSLLSLLIIVIGVVVPALCYNYNTEDPLWIHNENFSIDLETFKAFRDLGWIALVFIMIGSYAVPTVTWYHAHLLWPGVLWIMGGITCYWWAFFLMLRVFVFRKL